MLMAGLHFMKKVPFRTVYLHTMVTDEQGREDVEGQGQHHRPARRHRQHGADALRFALAWLTTSAAQGKNIKFAVSNVEDARRFANKIWNATAFALMNLEGYDPTASPTGSPTARPRRAGPARALDPVARAARVGGGRRRAGGVPDRRRGAGRLPLHLGRAVRLVHRAGEGRASSARAPTSRRARRSRGRW
jgi:hypothetical protein